MNIDVSLRNSRSGFILHAKFLFEVRDFFSNIKPKLTLHSKIISLPLVARHNLLIFLDGIFIYGNVGSQIINAMLPS